MDGTGQGREGVPVVAVMPITAPGADPDAALIAAGLHEEICGALTRFRSLQVISPHSAAVVADLDDAEIGARLGSSHLLRGRIVQDGARLRLRASLVSCSAKQQLWDERLEMPLEDFVAAQDDIVDRVAATLHARLEETALAEARRPTSDSAAHALVLQGLARLRGATLEDDEAARALFERALAREPLNARAHSGIALSWFNEWSCQYWDRFDEARERAVSAALSAVVSPASGVASLPCSAPRHATRRPTCTHSCFAGAPPTRARTACSLPSG